MAGGQVCNFARVAGGFSIPSWCLVLIGRDTFHERGEHTNFQERAQEEATDEDVAGAIVMGSRLEPVVFSMDEIPVEMFRPEFLKRATAAWKRDCAASGGKRVWEEPDRWPVVIDGRHRTVSGRAAEEKVGDTFYLVSTHKKLNDEERVGVQAASNAYGHEYTPMHKALDLIEFAKRNASDEAACAYFNCTRQTLANLRRGADLCAEVRAAVLAGKVAFTQAIKWALKKEADQREALALHLNPPPRKPREIAAPSKKQASAVADAILAGRHPTVPREVALVLQWRAGLVRAEDLPPDLAAVVLATEKGSKE
jgi:hypothetical protein